MTKALAIGVDCGSSRCKGALLGRDGLLVLKELPTGWNLTETSQKILSLLYQSVQIEKGDIPIVATGYGRDLVPGAFKTVTEISCHAQGAEYLYPGTRLVIDIGGQDSKIIAVKDGKVIDFQMNDKCAAGSGRFLDMVLNRLSLNLEEFDHLVSLGKNLNINSTCIVFAETEIISLLAKGVTREEIAAGVAGSLAKKIAAMAFKTGLFQPMVLSGGLSVSGGLAKILGQTLGQSVYPLSQGLYSGAIGAALLAMDLK